MSDGSTWLALAAGALAGLALGLWLRRARQGSAAPARRAETEPPAPDAVGALLRHVTQAVLVVDARDRLVSANPRARELFQLPEAAGGSFVALARSADVIDHLRALRAGGADPARLVELNRAPAANIWIRISGARLDEAGRVVLVAEDVSRLRRLETLEREFVANVSHDLRTPVTILRGYAETLAQDHAVLAPEERARFIAKIVSATGRLASLLEGMLALASLESGTPIRCEPGALATAAEEVVEAMGDRARAAGVALQLVVADRDGAADPTLARRLAQNLVDNALAHAQGADQVRVRVEGAVLSVEDNGPGVAEADLGRLFDRFYRTDRSRKQGGAGIGLSIVRQIAELHGGSVVAESARPRGLRVTARLGGATNEKPAV